NNCAALNKPPSPAPITMASYVCSRMNLSRLTSHERSGQSIYKDYHQGYVNRADIVVVVSPAGTLSTSRVCTLQLAREAIYLSSRTRLRKRLLHSGRVLRTFG